MNRIFLTCRRLAARASAVTIFMGLLPAARADFAYAYAEQQLRSVIVTGQGISNAVGSGSSTAAAAAINGSGISTNNATDTLQAYQGAAPPAPQNDYLKYSAAGGGPQAGDFTRGDALVVNPGALFTTGVSTANVAESFLSTGGGASMGPGLLTGSGSWSISGTFNDSSTTAPVSVNFAYANDIAVQQSGTGGPGQSSFSALITLKDQHGHQLNVTPIQLNSALTAPPNGPEVITSGTGSATLSLASLTQGDLYSITISGTELSSANINAVPEPSSLALIALGGGLGGLVALKRKRARDADNA